MNKLENEITYRIKQFTTSSDKDFIKALRIYLNSTPPVSKTDTNEITAWIDSPNKNSTTNLLFFGFYFNDTIIGYAEIAYVKTKRILILDYLVINPTYMSNSSFSTFFFLLLGHFEKNDVDYDYIVTEILVKYNEMDVEKDRIRLFENENFKVIHALYIQPLLEINNLESNTEALLMLYQRSSSSVSLRKETYLKIVKSIYFDHYHIWDSLFLKDDNEKNENYNKLIVDLKKIETSIGSDVLSDDGIKLNGYKNKLINNNVLLPDSSTKTIKSAFTFTIIYVLIIILILLGLQEFLNLNITLNTIIFTTVAIIIILFSFVSIMDKKGLDVLDKLTGLLSVFKPSGK